MRTLSVLTLFVLVFFNASCGKNSAASSKGNVSLRVVGAGANRLSALENFRELQDFVGFGRTAGDFNMNAATQLNSLRYIIGDIAVCGNVTTQGGFGFSAQTNCTSLYSKTIPTYGLTDLSASITLAQVQASAAAGNQVDFATPAGRALLAGSATVAPGSYNYAIVNWYPGIQVNGSVTLNGGVTVSTKSGGTVTGATSPVTGGLSDMSSGAAGDAFVVSANGGAAFRFASPFVVDATSTYNLDMTFNPQQVISACKNCGSSGNLRDGATHGIYVPMLTLLPVPRKSTDTTQRETYLVTVDANNKIRIELYYASSEPTKIYGVSAYLVFDTLSATPAFGNNDTCRVTDVTVNSNSSLKLVNNQFGTVVDGLTRGASGNVSTNTTGGCGGVNASLVYTFVGTDTVN